MSAASLTGHVVASFCILFVGYSVFIPVIQWGTEPGGRWYRMPASLAGTLTAIGLMVAALMKLWEAV